MTGNPSRKRKLCKQALHTCLVGRDVWIHFAVCPFEISIGDQRWAAMAWASDINHVEIIFLDDPVQMNVDEIQSWRGAPMPQEPRLDVILGQRSPEQWIVVKVDL